MELWFTRAMEMDSNYMEACLDKLLYLEPRWYGTAAEMVSFGRECVRSTRWGGDVPLMLVRAHESVARDLPAAQRNSYWKQPGVWPDVKASYEKYYALNPQRQTWRQNYTLSAYRAEQWDDLNKQLLLLGKTNYSFFGGKAEWDKMVELARQHRTK